MNTKPTAQVLNFNIPEQMTKQLVFKQTGNGKRKLVVSTNWLPLVGFEAGSPNIERSLGKGKGIVVERVCDLFDQKNIKNLFTFLQETS